MEIYVRSDGSLGVKEGRASGTPDTLGIYTAGGLFGVPGMHPSLVNAMVGPMGVEKLFRWVASDETNPIYDALVYIGSTGHSQDGLCADCGKPQFRECAQTAVFGRFCQQTEEIAFDQIGLRYNQGVPRMAMFGPITDPNGQVIVPQGGEIKDAFMLSVAGAAYNLRMLVGQVMWSGNPAANNGGYHEFSGLALVVNTSKVDAITGLDCNSLDSIMLNYGSSIVGATGSPSILSYIRSLLNAIRYRAAGANLNADSATTTLVMRPEVWDAVAAAAACEYGLQCNVGATTYNNAMEIAKIRDQYLSGMYLTIDGRNYPVLLDNLMPVTTTAYGTGTRWCSDIYALTTDIEGQTVMWGEYQDFNATASSIISEMRSSFGATPVAVTDGGRFAHAATFSGGFCMDVRTLTKPRILSTMPQLSGRVQNVCVVPMDNALWPAATGSGLYNELTGGASKKSYLDLYHDWESQS